MDAETIEQNAGPGPAPAGDTLGVTPEQIAAELDALKVETAGEPGGLPGVPGAPAPEPDPAEDYAELLEPVLFLGFQVLAPAWEVTAGESRQLAAGYAPLLAKYFPEGPGKIGPEIGAALVTVTILAPRLGKPRKPEPEPEPGAASSVPAGVSVAKSGGTEKETGDAQVVGALPE